MEPFQRFQQSRAVVEDVSSRTLAAIPSDFGRLNYLSSLKVSGTGQYEHDGLLRLYPAGAVQTALEHCHEEIFSRILEAPLREQERDLRGCIDAGGDAAALFEACEDPKTLQAMYPHDIPDYLRELFNSNMAVLAAALASQSG